MAEDIENFKNRLIKYLNENCPNIDTNSDRIVKVEWNYNTDNYFQTNIFVKSNALKNIMAELITEIGKNDSLVLACNTINDDNNMLDSIINAILKMPNIIEVNKNKE